MEAVATEADSGEAVTPGEGAAGVPCTAAAGACRRRFLVFFFLLMALCYHSTGAVAAGNEPAYTKANGGYRSPMNALWIGISAISLLVALFCLWRLLWLQRRFTAALTASDGVSIEQVLANHLKRVEKVDHHLVKLDEAYRRLAAVGSLASQKISIVRFNPFGDTGGDQSFVLAVLDAHNSGYVLTSIHGREGTRVYVKPVDEGKSKYPLSEEERQALAQATKRVPK
jgi:hypothetical protein